MESRPTPRPLGRVSTQQPQAKSRRQAKLRIAVLGEPNSGKTTLVNALVGAEILRPSVIDRTLHPTVVRFAANPAKQVEAVDRTRRTVGQDVVDDSAPDSIRRVHIRAVLERLKSCTVIDTPGVDTDDGDYDRRSFGACRGADLIIWCTPAMQAWKASEERAWLLLAPRVRSRGILTITFSDQVPSADMGRLIARLEDQAGAYFARVVTSDECSALATRMSERPRAAWRFGETES